MQSNKTGRKVIVGPLLACVLMGTADFLHARMAAEVEKGTAVIRGTVRSSEGEPLYGILVKARGEGRNYATSVFTDGEGNYELPPLPLGKYQVSVGTDWKETFQLSASGANQDFSVKLGTGFMNQTTGTSWARVIPITEEEKVPLNSTCARCHTIRRLIEGAPRSPDGWVAIVERMNSIDSIGRPKQPGDTGDYVGLRVGKEEVERITQILAKSIKPELKEKYIMEAIVRPTGEAARAVFTEWDLPHKLDYVTTATSDSHGMIWYVASVSNAIGRLDPSTGEFQQWTYPVPNAGFHDVMVDKEGNVWATAQIAGRIVKFDTKTYKYTDWVIPSNFSARTTHTGDFDPKGDYWVTLMGESIARLDPRTGRITEYPSPTTPARSYGLVVDMKGTVWYTDNAGSKIGKIDATGKTTLYPTPTPNADPRRIRVDSKGKVWFTEARASKLGMLDPATWKITEYDLGVPGGFAYALRVDKSDRIWFSLVNGGAWGRFDPETKKVVFYPFADPESYPRDGSFIYTTTPLSIVYGFAQKPVLGRMYIR